jgi:Rad3-related DNA helicase
MLDFNAPEPEPLPLVRGIITETGVGKTSACINKVITRAVAEGKRVVLAVPRHRLGDEIVQNIAKAASPAITARVYRGRDAEDPELPGKTMCQDYGRVDLIINAMGSITPHACRKGEHKCQYFDVCGYQRQQQQRPDVWVIPQPLLFRQKPSFIPPPDLLVIDEAFWSAALHGVDKVRRVWLSDLLGDRNVPRGRESAGTLSEDGKRAPLDSEATADLTEISRRVHQALEQAPGRRLRAALQASSITDRDLHQAIALEWRRKVDIKEVLPGMPLAKARKLCNAVIAHNRLVANLARFWELLARTLD